MKLIFDFLSSIFDIYGKWLRRFPVLFCLGMFCIFWLYRSYVYSGDGDQIIRMVEAGYWMVHSEILSQALFQAVYLIMHPYGWDGLSVVQFVSCMAGAVSLWVLLLFNRRYAHINPLWALGLFFSSGLALYCNGHTEYYTQFLVFLLLYGYMGIAYLRDDVSAIQVALVYSFSAWIHLGILFALPSLLFLPIINQYKWKDYSGIAIGLIPLVVIHFFKMYCSIFGLYIHGLSPSTNFVPLSPDPNNPDWYTFLSVWHVMDWVYGWAMRSWIFWFVVWLGIYIEGMRSILKPERLFLIAYTLCFTGFTIVWHPNLGIQQDWDLFAFEVVPCLLLVLTYMPSITQFSYTRTIVFVPVFASTLIMVHAINDEAKFDQRGYGAVVMEMDEFPNNLTFNGHNQYDFSTYIRQGQYSIKIIEKAGKKDFFLHTSSNSMLNIPVSTIPYTSVDSLHLQ